jgi:hypothetical protein
MTDGRHFRDEETVRLWPPADPWAAHDGRTAQWPTVDKLAARRARPHCVYWLPGWDGNVVRVGITVDLDARMARYERDAADPASRVSRWWPLVAQPVVPQVRWCDDWYQARAVEVAENGRLCPPGNYQDVPAERRARLHDAPAPRRARPAARPARSRQRRRVSWRVWLCLVLWALATAGCAVVLHLGGAPEQMIWALSPSFGAGAAWAMTMDIVRRGRKLKAWS